MCTFVILVVSYLFTGLAGCSVNPRISCDACKLARTPRIKKKKKFGSCLGTLQWSNLNQVNPFNQES